MDCHICNKVCNSFIHQKTGIQYYHCEECEYIFKSPKCYQNFEKQKERYNLHQNSERDEGYRAYFKHFLKFILPNISLSDIHRALDFGCGCTSLLAQLLEDKGINCDYYDPIYYPDNLDIVKKYDLIVSTEVFEHLHNPKEVFKELLDRLNDNGYLAIQIEFHTNDQVTFQKWWYPQDTTHIVFFRAKTFSVLCDIYNCRYITDNGKNMVLLKKNSPF